MAAVVSSSFLFPLSLTLKTTAVAISNALFQATYQVLMLSETSRASFHLTKSKLLSCYKIQKTSHRPAHVTSQSPASTGCTSGVWWGQIKMQVLEKIVRKFLVLQ